MSRTNKYNDKYRNFPNHQKSDKLTIHHCINLSSLGADCKANLIEILDQEHRAIHSLCGNKLPHNIMKTFINTICKPFQEGLKQDLFDVFDKWEGKEYKKNTYKGKYPKDGPHKGTL